MGQLSYMKWMPVGIAAVLHFLVDGLCVCMLYLMAEKQHGAIDLTAMFLTYNVLAFMTQPLTGWWLDSLRNRNVAFVLAAGFLAAATVLQAVTHPFDSSSPLPFFASSVLLGIGNSLFHVWGGKLTAVQTASDIRALGIFVSPGVLGLTVGILYASWWMAAVMLTLIILLGLIPLRMPSATGEVRTSSPPLPKPVTQTGFWLLVILTFVLMRSFVGEMVPFGMEKTSLGLLLLAATAMAGKVLGGWLARWWGISPAIAVCLGIPAMYLMWRDAGNIQLLPIAVAVFAINCTMPMTLYLANRLLPGREGLSFGLLAAVLIPGYLMAHNLHLSPDHNFMLSALLLTITIELGMLMLMGEKRRDVLIGSVAVNVLTNVPLNYFLLPYAGNMAYLAVGELTVLFVEMLWYFYFVRQWQRAAIYSLLCNVTSFLVGVLIQYLIYSPIN